MFLFEVWDDHSPTHCFAELVSVIGRYGRFDAEEVFSLLTVVSDGAGAELAGTVLRNGAKPYVEPRQRVESPFDR